MINRRCAFRGRSDLEACFGLKSSTEIYLQQQPLSLFTSYLKPVYDRLECLLEKKWNVSNCFRERLIS